MARHDRNNRFNPHGPYNRSAPHERYKRIGCMGPGAWGLETGRTCKSGGAGVHQGIQLRTRSIAAAALALVAIAALPSAAQTTTSSPTAGTARSILEPAVWQGPEVTAPNASNNVAQPSGSTAAASSGDSLHSVLNPLRVALQPTPPIPPQGIQVAPPTPPQTLTPPIRPAEPTLTQPLLDGSAPTEELMPPVIDACGEVGGGRRGVQPYGGGHPWDWSWGCGGSPYRTGPGICDNWKVGPRWHVTVDGIVMSRDETDLAALEAQMRLNDLAGTETIVTPPAVPVPLVPQTEQFGYGPGGRITFTSQIARCAGYDVQAVYEGINDWNSSIVFPKQTLPDFIQVIPPNPNTNPPDPFPEGFQQRSLHYRSTLNSGELNFLSCRDPEWRPFFGVRYLKFDESINDFLNQERQIPLPGPRTDFIGPAVPPNIAVNDPIGPTFETDRLNIFHLQNNLMGFQVGLLHDTIRLNERFAIEGFFSGGVYYNQIKYSNVMGVFTTQTFADNTRSTGTNDARVDESNIINNDAREYAEISYMSEASLTAVCRLNKCWALRGGYQALWIANVHLADAAYLGDSARADDLFFHGWHFGIECRR